MVSRVAAACLLIGSTTATSVLALTAGAFAQEAFSGGTVREIRIEGTQRIEAATVRSYLTVQTGDPFNAERIDESLKSLFATGLFADVTLRREGGTLVVNVVENPIINRVAFEGNRRVKTDDLVAEVQLRPRVVYTRTRVQNDVQRILEIYRRSGRFAARVEPKIVQLEQNRVDLIFEIDEGPLTGVQRINFINNNIFDDSDLRDIMLTKESRWWRFLSSNDTYDPDRLNYDREQIRRHYLRNGYADFRVLSMVAELTPDREDFFITMTVDEGKRYKFGEIKIQSDIKDLDGELLRPFILAQSGDWYDADRVESSINLLSDALGDLQYAFVEVDPLLQRNEEEGTIDLLFEINQSPRVFVERIDINGNVRTLDRVIRREMLLAEGDPFSITRVRRSEQRIKDLGFFEEVKVEPKEGSTPDQSVITVEVSEQPTGEIQLGAGYSTTDGALVDFSIRERNLLGRGQDLRFSTMLSTRSQEFDVSFTEPYFMERDLAVGVDLFRVVRDDRDTITYDLESTGIVLRAGYPLSDRLRQRFQYTLSQNSIENVSIYASRFIRDQAGTTTTSSIEQLLFYDARNSRLRPTDGYFISLSNEFAGLGGSVRYLRNRLSAANYWNVYSDWVLSLTGEVGYILELGKDIRINDRFFLGGDTLRGFEPGGVGPRDLTNGNDDALGGKRFARTSLEMTVPLGSDEMGVLAHAFADAGTLGDSGLKPYVDPTDPTKSDVFRDEDALRASIGVGLSWKSPFGPIRIDLAMPLAKQDYDRTEQFRFSFGTRFN
ncbi:outer membrane protein assembly factor BamA [Rhodospirillum centenum]|uniref:Outer membrane protein assembly factor BamA n=1 Tax=Rhodospirillum centenum (strain ATCC 51521 / SW) TaxID=414684 RepID=B6ISU3_RHOCS|nr:outer membrane protein, putative [Rhodospirillum centenum SW]